MEKVELVSGAMKEDLQNELPTMPTSSASKIVRFYENRSVFITGGSGFIGKVLIEKLLRTCTGINNIFVLIRPKWNRKVSERVEELLQQPLFDSIRNSKLEEKIVFVEGDVTLPELGLSELDLHRILNEVSVVFHSAATVKFDEPLKQSVAINIVGTRTMVELCSKMSQLAAFVHISTAYANCDKPEIDEHVYPVDFDPEHLIKMADWLNQADLQELKGRLLGEKPNTYTYTKALAEWLLTKSARDLPVAICRPSIVAASWREPFEGWIDNVNGPTGVILGAGKGLLRTMRAKNSHVADLVPVDSVINMVVSAAWFANVYRQSKRPEDYAFTDSLNETFDNFDSNSPYDSIEVYSSELSGSSSADCSDSEREGSEREPEQGESFDGQSLSLRNFHQSESRNSSSNGSHSFRKLKLRSRFPDEGYSSASQSADTKSNSSFTSSLDYSDTSNNINSGKKRPKASATLIKRHMQQAQECQQRKYEPELNAKLRKFRQANQLRLEAKNLPVELADVPVFHCTSGSQNPLLWGQMQMLVMSMLAFYPSIETYRYPSGSFTDKSWLDNFYRFTLHYAPAYIVDFITSLSGREAKLVRIYRKFDQAAKVLRAFTMKEWRFNIDNSSMLIEEFMSESDRKLFDTKLSELDWSAYIRGYVLGVRKHLLKEPISNLKQARQNLRFVYYRNLSLQVIFGIILGYSMYSWLY